MLSQFYIYNYIKNLFNKLKASEFFKNISLQVFTTAIAQVIPVAAMPLLTRLYSEQEFGIYATFLAVAMVLQVAVGGRYQFAIVVPKRDKDALDLFTLSVLLTIAYFVISFVVVLFLVSNQVTIFNISKVYLLVPFYVLFFGIWSSVSNYSIRRKKFRYNAFSKIYQSLTYVISGLIFGALSVKYYGLISARVGGLMMSSFYLWKKVIINFRSIKVKDLLEVGVKYLDYPKYGILPALMNTIAMQSIIFVFTHFYSKSDLGYFGLTNLVLNAPLALIGQSFRDIFYQRIAYLINNKFYKKGYAFFKRSALGLFLIGLPISLLIIFLGEEIFSIIFGDNWSRSGYFGSIMAFSFLIRLIASPLSSVFNAIGRVKLVAVWQSVYFFSTLCLMYLCIYMFNVKVESLLIIYVIHEVIIYSIYFIMQLTTLKKLCI
ncbi:oligosaccharide flippase family protein [Galbibacter sp. BG1]|uniref:lipopolysaccharide biosynthesis protein n=1 Tax=Galbibacter sp. BG1 TaxID=1170699 RepID=UPI0015BB9D80|nr:oligosaccharide flippase family protein [Galbibacter sp. BG1]QLE02359.1 oligosaccharide flippase family protein [Galbibacter sp. BG1]